MKKEYYKITIEKIVDESAFLNRIEVPKTTTMNFSAEAEEIQIMVNHIEDNMYGEKINVRTDNNVGDTQEKPKEKGTTGTSREVQQGNTT